MLEWAAAFRDQAIVTSDVEAYEIAHGIPFDSNLKEVSEALGPRKCGKGLRGSQAQSSVENRWVQRLGGCWRSGFQARSRNDSMSLLTMIM